jgi:uncharacterized membrane protein SirB2
LSPYLLARDLHIGCVIVSITLFVLRGGLMLAGSRWLAHPLLRITPHVVDTLLLTGALWLVHLTHRAPFAEPWLLAKIAGLVAYVVLGSLALRRGRTPAVRVACLAGALSVVAWIVSVARVRSPWGFLGGLVQ